MLIDTLPPAAKKAVAAAASPATMEVRVRSMNWEAPGVLSLELTALDFTALPSFAPGAHVDLHLPNGVMRQYSLCGDPADTSHYRIAIRSVSGGLSSQFIHRKLRPGEILTISNATQQFRIGGRAELSVHRRRHRHHAAAADDAGSECGAQKMDAPLLQPQR